MANSDSSLDSGFLSLATMEKFRVKRGFVRARTVGGGRRKAVKITHMSHLDASDVSSWSDANNLRRHRLKQTALSWTACFLSHDVVLQGNYDCANLLRNTSCISSNPVVMEADAFFPYCSHTPLVLSGYVVGEVVHNNVWIVHLSHRRSRQVTLEAGAVYLIGRPEKYQRPDFCHLCGGKHNPSITSCPTVLRFMPAPSHAHFKRRIEDYYRKGARVLTLTRGELSQIDCSIGRDDLCASCLQRALKDGAMWFRMDGSCTNRNCPNIEWCECCEEEEPDSGVCAHYIYIPQGTYNNLPNDDLAEAVANGTVKPVTACIESDWQVDTSRSLRTYAKKWLRMREEVSIEHLLKEFSADVHPLLKCEVMAMAMTYTNLADMIEGHKTFTLNAGIVKGFVINSEMMTVGPWLEGRIVKDSEGIWWQTGRREPILVTTLHEISTVCKSSIHTMRPSDDLGTWIA